jgi:hypothetical protein
MYKAIPDIGACTFWQLRHRDRLLEFVNIFAANDLESTITIWQRLGLGNPGDVPTFALVNLRADRIDRSLQYAEAVEVGLRADYYVLIGGIAESVQRRFERAVPAERLVTIGNVTPEVIFDRIAGMIPQRARIGGIGNIGGVGHEILAYVTKHGGTSC